MNEPTDVLPREIYALIGAGGKVIGLVLWDGITHIKWQDYRTVRAQGAEIGWVYGEGDVFSAPVGGSTVPESSGG